MGFWFRVAFLLPLSSRTSFSFMFPSILIFSPLCGSLLLVDVLIRELAQLANNRVSPTADAAPPLGGWRIRDLSSSASFSGFVLLSP